MKTYSITKWAALLLTFSGMAALPLTVRAAAGDNMLVTTSTAEANKNYLSNGVTNAALQVSTVGVVYSGTNINATGTAQSSAGRLGVYAINQGKVMLNTGTILTTGTLSASAVYITNTSAFEGSNLRVTTSGESSQGLNVTVLSTARLVNSRVETTGYRAQGIIVSGTSSLFVDQVEISTAGTSSYAVNVGSNSSGTIQNSKLTTTGDLARAVQVANSFVEINNTTIETSGSNAFGVLSTTGAVGAGFSQPTTINLNNVSVHTTGEHGHAVAFHSAEGISYVTISGGTLTAERGSAVKANPTVGNESEDELLAYSGTYYLTVKGGAILSGTSSLELTSLRTGTNAAGERIEVDLPTVGFVSVEENSQLNGDLNVIGSASATVNFDNSTLTGDVNGSGSSSLTISGSNGTTITGNVNAKDDANVTVNLDNGTIIGDITGSGSSTLNVSGKDSTVTGNVNSNDDANVSVNLDNGKLTGDINSSGSSTINISGSNGATVTGTATSKDDSNININISGPGSSWLGDVNQQDDSKIIINIDNGASGTGGFNGGNLIVGPDGEFHFDKDSNLDNSDNNGNIWVGDHNNYINVDGGTITGTGNWIFPVDTDTGDHSTITGTTPDGEHPTAIIDPKGDGRLDPNDVLNDLVTGDGRGNWIYPDFDWGLEEYTRDGTNPDGSPHFKPSGKNSLAGSVLNSSAALQQTMWFAQQNSLLKRMGELRFAQNSETGKVKSEKEVETLNADSLINNVWIRSYGQQLNVSGKVAGHSYEQMVYGVDLGTDHKFTIDANNNIYLGIFAGYGQSDVDYRAARAEGELNSYYGGLYTTWLHDSGFYIDLTFKAASVDNELKTPYGTSQIRANYNDVNIGGSIELGKKFTFQDDWFIEPQLQANYLHILAEDYQAGPLSIKTQDMDALQLRLGLVAGRTLKLSNGGAIQPYLKVSGVEMISSGGEIRNRTQTARANIDGARAELGAGIIWQLDANNQLHLDYEASFGDKYDKPWGLTAGYRYQF